MDSNKQIIYERAPEVDFFRIFQFLFRYKWFMLIFTSALSFIALLFFLITDLLPPGISPLPDLYRPDSILLINDKANSSLLPLLQNISAINSSLGISGAFPSSFSYGELAIQLLKSKTILDMIAGEFQMSKRYGIKKNPVGKAREKIAKHLFTAYDEKTMLITIGYEDYDPEFASRVVNRFVELLDSRFTSIGGNKNITQKNFLENNLVEVKAQMHSLEAEIQKFQKKYGVLDIESLAAEQVTMMARFRSQLILTEMEIKTYTNFSTIEDPVSKRLKAERDNLWNLIQEMESGYSEYYNALPSQKDLPDLSLQFYHLKRDLSVREKIYEILSQQYELIKLSLENTEPIFQVIEMADVPDLKTAPSRVLLTVLAVMGSAMLSIILVFAHYIFKKGKELIVSKNEESDEEEEPVSEE